MFEYAKRHNKGDSFKKLEGECFGGNCDSADEGIWAFRAFSQNIKSAYMLVYERRMKTPLKRLASRQTDKSPAILDCENTAPTRVALNRIYFDPKKQEHVEFVDFHAPKQNVPTTLYREVWQDNGNFLFERQIYSAEFFRFVSDILKESLSLVPIKAETETAADTMEARSMTRIAGKVVFEVLAHAYQNESIRTISEQLMGLFQRSRTAARELLDYLTEDVEGRVMAVLHRCPEREVRSTAANLIIEMVCTLLTETKSLGKESACKLRTFMDSLCEGVTQELSQNWLRFEQYFDLLYGLAQRGGEKIVALYYEKHMMARLLDFYLGTKSPLYVKTQRRYMMGNKVRNPRLEPLVGLVCFLALKFDLQEILGRKCENGEKPAFALREDEKKCLEASEFVEKTVIEGYVTPEFCRLIAMVIFENEKRSKNLCKLIMCALNEDPGKDMTPNLSLLRTVLELSDSLQCKRLEWLLGVGSLQKAFVIPWGSAKPHEKVRCGLELVDSVRDTVSDYSSVLNYNTPYDSLLNLLWRHRKSFDLAPVRCLLAMMLGSQTIFEYVMRLPPPTYNYAKYTDWIRPLVEGYRTSYRSLFGITFGVCSPRKKAEDPYEETKKLVEELERRCALEFAKHPPSPDQPPGLLRAHPPPYLLGRPTEEHTLLEETKEGVTLVVSELVTETYRSLPTGADNLGIPKRYAEKQKAGMQVLHPFAEEGKAGPKAAGEAKKEESPLSVEPTVLKIEVVNRIFFGS